MSQPLVARAAAIKARNKTLESVPGSGFHDDDKDHRGQPRCPQKRRDPHDPEGRRTLPRASDHLVPFYDERHVHFVGADAVRAKEALDAYHAAHATAEPAVFSGYTGTQRKLLTIIPKTALSESEGVALLSLHRDEWNDLLFAMYTMGLGFSGAPFEE